MGQRSGPTGTRPAMFYQPAKSETGIRSDTYYTDTADRIRIVYPDGYVEWCTLSDISKSWNPLTSGFMELPCYLKEWYRFVEKKPKTFKEAIRLITRFDDHHDYPKQEFLGELWNN